MVDKRTLIDSVLVTLQSEPDKWQKTEPGDTYTLEPVRFDRVSQHTGSANGRTHNKQSTIFVYTKFCQIDIDDSWLGATIFDGRRTYKLSSYSEIYHPLTNKLVGYELDVI